MNQIAEILVKLEKVNGKRLEIALRDNDLKLFCEWVEYNRVIAEGYAKLAEFQQDRLEMNKETNYDHAVMDSN